MTGIADRIVEPVGFTLNVYGIQKYEANVSLGGKEEIILEVFYGGKAYEEERVVNIVKDALEGTQWKIRLLVIPSESARPMFFDSPGLRALMAFQITGREEEIDCVLHRLGITDAVLTNPRREELAAENPI